VDGPVVARGFCGLVCAVGCAHVSGLFNAVRMTAGPDEVRGWKAIQVNALLGARAHGGFVPSPVRPVCHHLQTCPRNCWRSAAIVGRLPCYRDGRRAVCVPAREQGPDDAGHLVGQRDTDQAGWPAGQQRLQPSCFSGRLSIGIADYTGCACKRRRYGSPCLEILPSRSLPPVECDLGARPSHAAKCRADLNWLASAMLAASAEAVIGPTPGIDANRRLTSFSRWLAMMAASKVAICFPSACSCERRARSAWRAIDGSIVASSAMSNAASSPTRLIP
jgi:hypothetical protein